MTVEVARGQLALGGASVPAVDVAWHEPGEAATAAVVVTHGAGGDLDDPVLVAFADLLAAGGHVVARANLGYRQRRPSGPPPRAEASVDDLAAIVAAADAARPGHCWVAGGKSYGGRVATLLAASGADLAGVACLSYPLHPPGRPDRLRVAHFPDITAPMLVVQGGNDPFGRPDELAPHLEALEGPATLLAVPNADHSLHVARTRSGDGATHRSPAVLAHRTPQVLAWLAEITTR